MSEAIEATTVQTPARVHQIPVRPVQGFVPPTPGGESKKVVTSIVDSIKRDTISDQVPVFATQHYRDSVAVDFVSNAVSTRTTIHSFSVDSSSGKALKEVQGFPAGGSSIAAIVMGLLLLLCFFGKGVGHALLTYSSTLISVRRRNNAFDDNVRVSLPASIILAVVFIVFGGISLNLGLGIQPWATLKGIGFSMGVVGVYYLFQLVAYNLIGYAFAPGNGRTQWVDGFAASQAFAGLLLVVPALLMLCVPEWHTFATSAAVFVYFCTRIVFISKGFRIFYRGISSLLYFILYLCSLEIIPILIILGILRQKV